LAHDPKFVTMVEEIFGPVLTIHVNDPATWDATLKLVDSTSPYALTGAVFAQDRSVPISPISPLELTCGAYCFLIILHKPSSWC